MTKEEAVLGGNAGKRPLPASKKPFVPPSLECPDWVSDVAKAFWAREVPGMIEREVVGNSDWSALVILAQAWAEMQIATDTLNKEGRIYIGHNGTKCTHPCVKMQTAAMKIVNSIMAQFGMQPTTRARLPVVEPPSVADQVDQDPYSEFRNG